MWYIRKDDYVSDYSNGILYFKLRNSFTKQKKHIKYYISNSNYVAQQKKIKQKAVS